MENNKNFDVIIIGGSYSGLAAGMALGRALRQVLIIDSGKPCNRQTPYSHNFITQDGSSPKEIAELAKQQVEQYSTISFFDGLAIDGAETENGFEITVAAGEIFSGKKLIFATGIRDILPDIEGFAACWGISALHCPYCHGYEIRNEKTGILGNGEYAFEFSKLISNWTKDLTLFTNGTSTLTAENVEKLKEHKIEIVETAIESLRHRDGYLSSIILSDGSNFPVKALYAQNSFEQHCRVPEKLGCELTPEGYITIDSAQETTVKGIFACGDNANRMRTVANAVAMGTATGMLVNKILTTESF